MRVAANLTMMFPEKGALLRRYEAAAEAGFKLVECAFPYSESLDNLAEVKEKHGLQQVLINTPLGKSDPNTFGMACDPRKITEFRESIETAIRYAKRLKCPRIHMMSGIPPSDVLSVEAEATFESNLRYAAHEMEKEGITCLIETLSPAAKPGYFLFNFDQAIGYIEKVRAPNLKLQLDIFHAQLGGGNLTATIKKCMQYTGHIQVAQVPDRHEPDSEGEINYGYVFKLLKELGSENFIGAEYIPKSSETVHGLGWIQQFGLEM